MEKSIQFLIWLVFMTSYSAFGLIKDQLSNETSSNYNSTGVIIQRNYNSDLTEDLTIIKTYKYIGSNKLETPIKTTEITSPRNASYTNVDMLFALIPKKNDYAEEITRVNLSSNSSNNKILLMSMYLDDNYLSPIIKDCINESNNRDLITKESKLFLQHFNNYLNQQELNNIFSKEKALHISKSITGAYGLFMPWNFDRINKFNGIGRILPSTVSIIDDLLLTADDFNSSKENITKEQIAKLQLLIFKAAQQAKTVLFIPKCILQKDTVMRIPLALINEVNLDEETGVITLNLIFCKQPINDFHGFYNFIEAKKSLLGINNSVVKWEFMDYYLALIGDTDNTKTEDKPYRSNSVALHYISVVALADDYSCVNNQPYYHHDNTEQYLKQLHNLSNSLVTTYDTNIKPPCGHYERKCLVKLNCGCNNYWPCHRCHNASKQIVCNKSNLRAKDTKKLKCLVCDTEQDFTQYCINCNTEFANYFCGICKHLTGMKDSPGHCKKCGICRIHSNRSYHCDICGVCLDVQLQNNHKCRAGSEHDDCCICLEDAFTGCQILPCSHKVHKECATLMINHGITICPICRASFTRK